MSKTLSECPEIEVQDIDHPDIVTGIVDQIGMVELIDELIPSHQLEKIGSCGFTMLDKITFYALRQI